MVACERPIWKPLLLMKMFGSHLPFSYVVPSPSGPILSRIADQHLQLTIPSEWQALIPSTIKITFSSTGQSSNHSKQQTS